MPQKKPKKKAKAITLRFTGEEIAPLEHDRRDLAGSGVPVKIGAYAKHAVQSFPRLRKLEAALRMEAAISDRPPEAIGNFARQLLDGLR
jgi:hypothetical protein